MVAIRNQIPGRPGPAMTEVLRSIGDQTTTAPDNYQGLMPWSVREQVRFMGALANGKVVSRAASDYLLESMRPISAHAWGLGTIGATAYKGGWLRSDTVTRQMGIVDGYAVAIITDGVGPAVRQTDGDSAHVRQLNRLARMLEKRLAYEECAMTGAAARSPGPPGKDGVGGASDGYRRALRPRQGSGESVPLVHRAAGRSTTPPDAYDTSRRGGSSPARRSSPWRASPSCSALLSSPGRSISG